MEGAAAWWVSRTRNALHIQKKTNRFPALTNAKLTILQSEKRTFEGLILPTRQ